MNKFFNKPLVQRFSTLFISKTEVDRWAQDWSFFFVLGFGRSGTEFMASFLNQAANADVFHEPVLEDFYAHSRAHYSHLIAEKYMKGFRKKEIYIRMRHKSPSGIYGEVNSVIRCHAKAIPQAFPNAKLLHLVRDGCKVIRSLITRRIMTAKDPFPVHPIDSDPWKDRWSEMDRFARLCWFWQEENRRLRTTIGNIVQFEKIIESYDYLDERVLQPLGLNISKETWESTKALPINTTPVFGMPKWEEWTPVQKKVFREICGDEMNLNGYLF